MFLGKILNFFARKLMPCVFSIQRNIYLSSALHNLSAMQWRPKKMRIQLGELSISDNLVSPVLTSGRHEIFICLVKHQSCVGWWLLPQWAPTRTPVFFLILCCISFAWLHPNKIQAAQTFLLNCLGFQNKCDVTLSIMSSFLLSCNWLKKITWLLFMQWNQCFRA